jgi:hypothetical protein
VHRRSQVSLLAELHQSLDLPPLLSELTQQGILLAPSASSVRWVHDKFKEATRTTIAAGDARRKKHEEMASFLEKRPGFLFDGPSTFWITAYLSSPRLMARR